MSKKSPKVSKDEAIETMTGLQRVASLPSLDKNKGGAPTKKEIEELGIEKFIEECRKNVFNYKKEWEEFTERIGYWLDLENAYITCDSDYIESLWWILKQIWDKGLLYQDYNVVPYCPRCGTSLSSHEVAQGYKKVTENSIPSASATNAPAL